MEGLAYELSTTSTGYKSFIIGSMHVSDKRVMALMNSFYSIIDRTETVAFEIDLSSSNTQLSDFLMPGEE